MLLFDNREFVVFLVAKGVIWGFVRNIKKWRMCFWFLRKKLFSRKDRVYVYEKNMWVVKVKGKLIYLENYFFSCLKVGIIFVGFIWGGKIWGGFER